MDLQAAGAAAQAPRHHGRGTRAGERVDDHAAFRRACPDEKLRQALGHGSCVATGSLVLVVRLRHGHHIARISAAMQVCRRPIPPEACIGVAAAQLVELAPLDFLRGRLIGHPDRVEVKVRLRSLGERVDVFEAVLRPRPEPSRHGVGLRPDVGLQPAPALLLQGQHELVDVGMPLALQQPGSSAPGS